MAEDAEASFGAALFAAQEGADWGFTQLFEHYEPAVAGFVRSRGVRDADDVVNDVFLAVFAGLRTFTGDSTAFRAWTFRITRNKVADWYRESSRDQRRIEASEARAATAPDVVDPQESVTTNAGVEALLTVLTEEQREVLLLRVVAGLSGPQTAEVLDKPLTAVKALQRRGLEAMRREIRRQAVSNS